MRKLIMNIASAGLLSVVPLSAAVAAPVPGFEDLYNAVFTACTLPAGELQACEAAINAYSGALVASTELSVANQSFTELRAEVFTANAADEQFQTDIDALFELLLPDSGAIAPAPVAASPV